MNRVPPSRIGVQRAQVADEKRADEAKAKAGEHETKAEEGEKHERHHTTKAGKAAAAHQHVLHHTKKVRVNQHHHDAHMLHMAEALGWTPESSSEAAERKMEADDAHEEEQREKANADAQKRVGATTYAATAANKAEAGHDNKRDAFQKKPTQGQKPQLNSKSAELPNAVTASKTIDAARAAAERMLKAGKPLDAFALLQLAEPPGVLFKENGHNETEMAAAEDPELAAAVAEMIQKLFGVKGILRVGAGRNQAEEPVIVVAVGQGFGEASLRAVPEGIGKFPTLVALPFDILPLKKER